MSKILTIKPGYPRFYSLLSFDYDHKLQKWLKDLPGIKKNAAWDDIAKAWRVPTSFVGPICGVFREQGYGVEHG